MSFGGDYTKYFEHLSTDANWHPFIESTAPTGDRLFRLNIQISAKRVSNGDSAVWSSTFGFKRTGSGDLDIVGAGTSDTDAALVSRDVGASTWRVRLRVSGDTFLVEGMAGLYDVEWRADINIDGFQHIPE